MADHSVGRFGSIRPEMEDDPVRLGRNCGDFLGLGIRHIEMPATPARVWAAIQEVATRANPGQL